MEPATTPKCAAGASAGVLPEPANAEPQAMGAGALIQAVTAIAIMHGSLGASGIDVGCSPALMDVEIEGNVRTAIRLNVERRAEILPAS